jgi:hypothetical protein
MSVSPSRLAQQLVNAFAAVESTEGLIIFVAGADHMLEFCQELLELYDRNGHPPLLQEVNSLCRAQAILPAVLFAELRKVLLALNRFHDAGRDHYAILGLPPGASREEVKKAYRNLSKQYHPDRLGEQGDQAQRFMEIAGAYHAIMTAVPGQQPANQGPWRRRLLHVPGRPSQRPGVFFLGIAAMVCLLIGASVYLAARYDSYMISRQLRTGDMATRTTGARDKPAQTDTILQRPPEQHPPSRNEDEVAAEPPGVEPIKAPLVNLQTVGPQQRSSPLNTPVAFFEPILRDDICQGGPSPSLYLQPQKPTMVGGENSAEPMEQESRPMLKQKHTQPVRATPAKTTVSSDSSRARPAPASPPLPTGDGISLINQYRTYYTRRELPAFLTLFSEQARENGHPLASMTAQYRSLFAHTRAIDLQIVNMKWEELPDGLQATGSFSSSYTYTDGRIRGHRGEITFRLIRENGMLKIGGLEYSFLE